MPEQRLKFLEELGKKAQKDLDNFYNSPSLKALKKDLSRMATTIYPVVEAHNKMHQSILNTKDFKVFPTQRPATIDEIDYLISKRIPENDSVEIFYKDKTLTRTVQGKKLLYQFDKGGKRERAFESILEQGSVPTASLKKVTKSPTDEALRKLIGDINRAVTHELKVRIIEFNRGKGGYAISKDVTVIS